LTFFRIVSSRRGDETILVCDETIFRLWRRTPETADGYQPATKRRTAPAANTGDSQMRTFILAFAFVLAGSSIVGSPESSLPGIGTFAYSGSPIVASAPQAVVVAALGRN
jgi:hypothetical protein